MRLPSASAFRAAEAPGGGVCVSSRDLGSDFYRVRFPEGMGATLTLLSFSSAGTLPELGLGYLVLGPSVLASSQVVVLPMGFSRALRPPRRLQLRGGRW